MVLSVPKLLDLQATENGGLAHCVFDRENVGSLPSLHTHTHTHTFSLCVCVCTFAIECVIVCVTERVFDGVGLTQRSLRRRAFAV